MRLAVRDDPYALDVPAGRHLWGATTLSATCPSEQGGGLLVVAADGTSERVDGLSDAGTGTCSAQWDVAAEADGVREWPDGAYQLVLVGADGVEASERVPVTVAVTEATTQRLKADYAVGLLTSDELANLLTRAAVDPQALPGQYRVGEEGDAPRSADLVQALTASGLLSDELAQLLTPVDEAATASESPPVDESSIASTYTTQATRVTDTVCGRRIRYLHVLYDCVVASENFVVYYDSRHVGPLEQEGGEPAFVTLMVDSLEDDRRVYEDEGFRMPPEPTNVFLSAMMPTGAGISLPPIPAPLGSTPAAIIMDSDPANVRAYLPHHEFFHQVQYQYVSAQRVASPVNNPYWWMEATAEWGAHLV